MTRTIIAVVAVALVGTVSAEAAARKSPRPEARALRAAAVAAHFAAPLTASLGRPSWAAANECFTDDGYGRFWPCSAGPCGR